LILDSLDHAVTPAIGQYAPSVLRQTIAAGVSSFGAMGGFKNLGSLFNSGTRPQMDTFDYGSQMGASYPMSI